MDMSVNEAHTPGSDIALAEWSSVCRRLFCEDSDPTAEEVLAFFDQNCHPGADGASSLGSGPAAPSANAVASLHSVGLLGYHPAALEPEVHARYVAARNRARVAVHAELLATRRQRLAALLAESTSQRAEAHGAARDKMPPLAGGPFEGLQSLVSDFVAHHQGSIGTHPFLSGLRGLLQQQLGNQVAWRWAFQEEVLLEAGNERFMEEAVRLLAQTLQYVPDVAVKDCEAGVEGPRLVTWEVAADTSDRYLRKMLQLLPAASRLEGRATGELMPTTAQRTNMAGESDKDRECIVFSRVFRCNIL